MARLPGNEYPELYSWIGSTSKSPGRKIINWDFFHSVTSTSKQRHSAKAHHQRQSFASAWEPLREPLFRALWIAAVASNVGTWMEDVGEAWLMTSLSASTLMVALVETAGSLPIVLLAVPSGAFADIIDRRRLLLITQAWMLIVAATLGVLTVFGLTTPWLLLSLAFALGLGAAANGPAYLSPVRKPGSE